MQSDGAGGGDESLDFPLSLHWQGLGHSVSVLLCWNRVVIFYRFSVLLGCPFPGSLSRKNMLCWGFFFFFFSVSLGVSMLLQL